jgi:hypothetical protein
MGNMNLTIDRTILADHWEVTPIWHNVGKTDAIKVRGWTALKYFKPAEKVKDESFIDIPDGVTLSAEQTVVPGDTIIFGSKAVAPVQVQEFADQTAVSVIYGYIEYDDLFDTSHIVRFCRLLNFERVGPLINFTLPVKIPLPCERRTETKKNRRPN